MSRGKDFVRGLSASWAATFITVAYSFASVPLALAYLTVEEFGLFMLVVQVAGYFALLDLGMSGATARILIDHKEDREAGEYGAVIVTGALVFAVQSFLLLFAAFFAAPSLVALLAIPHGMNAVAVHLLRWMAVAFALGTAMRIFSSVLYANRRIDIVNLVMSLVPLASLVLIWIVLAAGGGLRWLPAAFVPPALIAGGAAALACRGLGLLPTAGHWGRPRWKLFAEMFGLGRDIFMVNAGAQVLDASQMLIVTRTMGLTSAAVWSVSTKLFNLVFQLVTKIEGAAAVFFSEMIARGEWRQLEQRFRQIYQLTAGVTVAAVAVCVAINGPFVSLWAGAELAWAPVYSLLLGLVVCANCFTRCHVDLIVSSKNIGALRYVYFAEACAFVAGALWAGKHAGFGGILAASLLCAVVFRGVYTSGRTAALFGNGWTTVSGRWLSKAAASALALLPAGYFLASWAASGAAGGRVSLIINGSICGAFSVAVLWLIALPADVRQEVAGRLKLR